MSTLKATNIQNAASSTTNVVLNTDGTITTGTNMTVTGTAVMSSPYTMRNLIINGAMQIWQRGTSFTDPTASNFYTADRWGANRNGDATGITVSRSTSVPTGFQYSLALQRTAGNAGTAALSLYYSNETVNCIQYQGQSVTFSFYARAGANYSGGGLNVSVSTGTGTDQRVYAYTGASVIISTTQAITTTWTRYTFTGTVPSNATEIGFGISWTPTGTAGADDTVYFTGVQLERGTVATPFEWRNYQQELAMCQRYCYVIPKNTYMGLAGQCYGTNVAQGAIPMPVSMRVGPTLTAVSDFTGFNIYSSTASFIQMTVFTVAATATTELFFWNCNVASGLTAGNATLLQKSPTNVPLIFSSEL